MCEDANSKLVDVVTVADVFAEKRIDDSLVGECVRSNINFHPRNQDVYYDMFEMYCCVIQRLGISDGSDGT